MQEDGNALQLIALMLKPLGLLGLRLTVFLELIDAVLKPRPLLGELLIRLFLPLKLGC